MTQSKPIAQLIFILTSFTLSAQDVDNLFYCNDNHNIDKVFILNDDNFIAYQASSNSILLYDANHLPVDTLNFGEPDLYLLQSAQILSEGLIYFDLLNEKKLISTTDGRLKVKRSTSIKDVGYENGFLFFDYENLQFFQKNKSTKKNTIDYSIVASGNNQIIDLFEGLDLTQSSKYNGSGQIRINFYLDQKRTLVYLPVEGASKLIIFNYSTFSVDELHFPDNDFKTESWYTYYDYIDDRLYAILYRKKGLNDLYRVDRTSNKLKKIKSIGFVVKGIINGKLYKVVSDPENKKALCHYLIPIGRKEETKVLDDVEVKHKN